MNSIDWGFMFSAFPALIEALPITLLMAVAAMVFAVIGGLILALITKNRIPVLHQLSKVYISFFRACRRSCSFS